MDRDDLDLYESAFNGGSGGCRITCEGCNREFFDNTDQGGWDWEAGELEGLRGDPEKIGLGYTPVTVTVMGKECCNGCICWHKEAEKVLAWLRANRESIVKVISADASRALEEAAAREDQLKRALHIRIPDGWRPIREAPQDATWIEILCPDGKTQQAHHGETKVVQAHFAQDLSGEEQPPFKGWFFAPWAIDEIKSGRAGLSQTCSGFSKVEPDPIAWRPIPGGLSDYERQRMAADECRRENTEAKKANGH